MSTSQKLARLATLVQSLNSGSVLPYARYHIKHLSTIHRTSYNRIWKPILTPVAALESSKYMTLYQYRASSHTASSTKLERFLLPDIGEGINEVVIKGWQVKVGDVVKQFDPICEVESDKATVTISSRYDGTIKSIHYEVDDMAKVGKPLVDIEVLKPSADELKVDTPMSDMKESKSDDDTQANTTSKPIDKPNKSIVPALPSVRRFAQEMNVDLALIKATGSRGQILKEDILAFLRDQSKDQTQTTSTITTLEPTVDGFKQQQQQSPRANNQSTSVVPIRGIQRAMYKTMTESLKIPHFNYADEIDLTELVEANSALRLHRNNESGSEAKKIATFAFIIKLVSLALKDYPQLNASIDDSGENLIYKHYHNIGVAVDTKAGLIVPNIKNVQDLSIEQVNLELIRLRELAYASKLGPNDLSGATISLSNIGAIGGIFGVPVIVSPEIVIGALGRIQKLPRFNSQKQVEARHILKIVWSADHRVVDGATLARFSNLLKRYLESPHSALLKLS